MTPYVVLDYHLKINRERHWNQKKLELKSASLIIGIIT